MIKISKCLLQLFSLVASIVWFSATTAQQSIEEVVVTATLKEQNEMDTPISMDILTGDEMTENSIMQMYDISARTPAVHVHELSFANRIFLRGVGSGNEVGQDQSVGTFIDGVYQGRSATTAATLMDVERVEVLKGPQTTYFGNNSVGGAFSFITKSPKDKNEASISGTIGSHGEQTFTGILSGPLSDTFKARLALQYHGMDGFLKNTNPAGPDHPKRDGTTARGVFIWDASENVEAKLKIEMGRLDMGSGVGWQQINCPPDPMAYPNGSPGGAANACQMALDTLPNFEGDFDDQYSGSEGMEGKLDTDQIILTLNAMLGDAELTSITSYTSFAKDGAGESDISAIPQLPWRIDEETDQRAQEFRLSGSLSNTIDYMVGAYAQKTEIDSTVELGIYNINTGAAVAAQGRSFEQEQDLHSLFATVTWSVSDKLKVIPGLRWTDVEKDVTRAFRSDPTGQVYASTNIDFSNLNMIASDDMSLSDSATTPSLLIQYYVDESSMIYFSYADGYKSGGFEYLPHTKIARKEGGGEFGSESVDSFEIGYKGSGDNYRIAAAIFVSKYKGMQLSSYIYPEDTATFGEGAFLNVNNLDTTSQGVELELSYLITEKIRADLSYTMLDATYDDHKLGQCPNYYTDTFCDHTGQNLIYAPDNSGLLTLSYDDDLRNNLNLDASVSVYFTDDFYTYDDYDPVNSQKGYSKIDARIAISSAENKWHLALLGKNLTDKETTSYNQMSRNIGSYVSILERTRSFALQFGYSF